MSVNTMMLALGESTYSQTRRRITAPATEEARALRLHARSVRSPASPGTSGSSSGSWDGALELGEDGADAVVDGADHRRVALHVAGEHFLLVGSEGGVPGRDILVRFRVAWWQLGVVSHDAELDLAGQATLPNDVSTNVVAAAHGFHVGLCGVHGAVGAIEEERLVGVDCLDLMDHAYGPVGGRR